MRNANAWCVSYLGILMAGGCATLLNGWWQGGELAAGIEDSEAKLVIADVQRAARLAEPGVQHGAQVVTLDIAQPLDRRSGEHTSEIQSLIRIANAGFCLKNKTDDNSL